LPSAALARAQASYRRFIDSTAVGDTDFRLTVRAEPTPYARCFALFGLQLLRDRERLAAGADRLAAAIRSDLDAVKAERTAAGADLRFDKAYLQLLTFSLSALAILERLDADPLRDHVLPMISQNIEADFARARVLDGAPGSGNQAMFMAILLLHARDRLGEDDQGQIARWLAVTVASMNEFGFWGPARSMSHLQFQNGYHQYEILEYLDASVPRWDAAADHVASLADPQGHFAPYPGGGACYDYDATLLITGGGEASVRRHAALLRRTASSILAEQSPDGGFCESHCVRPRSVQNVLLAWRHLLAGRGAARLERLRHGLTLLRPRHDRIRTHWSRYSRQWNESDLWDSWFRMLTLARIDVAFDPSRSAAWGFIDYPGIGYHHSLGPQAASV
jgi:hypothetical protein